MYLSVQKINLLKQKKAELEALKDSDSSKAFSGGKARKIVD